MGSALDLRMKITIALCCVAAVCSAVTNTHAQSLLSGPMLGHVDMREARIWVQTAEPSDVTVEYADSLTPTRWWRTAVQATQSTNAHTATLVCDSVEPGRTYVYRVLVNGKVQQRPFPMRFKTPIVWKWQKTDPPTMTMALGSCFYVNQDGYERSTGGYGSNYQICSVINQRSPDIMLWLGDNVYLREPDWNSRSGIFKRYSHTRALPELQPLLARTAHYATWDDHDFGPNDSDRGWHLRSDARDAFMSFWPNPSYGRNGQGIFTVFAMADVDVIVLDDRWWRSPDKRTDESRTMLGAEQFSWLMDVLHASTATFKLVAIGSQVLTDNLRKECYARMPEERQRLLDALAAAKIPGVLFLSGDIHASELSKLERPETYPLYEFTCSALTAGSNKEIEKQSNAYRVAGTAVGANNAGFITVTGGAKQRKLILRVVDFEGVERWTREITEQELR